MDDLAIGRLAADVGVTTEAIRYYERVGVLREPRRNEVGQRRYEPRVIDELRLVKAAQTAGFTLADIARLLDLTREDPVPCQDMCAIVQEQVARLDERLRELAAARARLADALAACEPAAGCIVADCLLGEH
ncbi:MAG: MerR family transcriptional regulator [Longimicrobiales bacterium]